MRRVIILFALISLSTQTIVKWLPRSSFNLPINFKDGKLPCSRQTVIFPETLGSAVKLEGDIKVAGFVLPNDGEFFLESGTISFGEDQNNSSCPDDSNVQFIQRAISAWNEPDVWSSPKFNKATPDAERVPCFDDVVEFPKDMTFTCQLPEETQHVRQLRFGNSIIEHSIFDDFLLSYDYDEEMFLSNSNGDYSVELGPKSCNSRGGCPCQQYRMQIDCSVKYCPVPSCVAPIQPEGHCCKICGGALLFDVDQSFEIMVFKELVEETVNSYGGLVYHIGRIGDKVQLVVVEKEEYDGTSTEAVNRINYLMQQHWVRSEKQTLLSGSPMYKYGLGGKLFVSMFFVVVFVLGLVYGYYYKLPDVRNPLMGRGWFNVRALARFQRRSESVVSLTRRDSAAAPGFRNPLYDSRRGRVLVTESTVED